MFLMRTYDIINAGPNNRFMANGKIVSNSGAIVQLQNLYRNSLPDLDQARELVKAGDYDAIETLYDSAPDVLAQCVRTAFIPTKGMKFIVADFSAIEARVVAWLAGEQWKLDAFANGEDIYCATASEMYHKPVVKHGENGELRQHGKICELACGYGGSTGALKAFGALENGMKEEELQPMVDAWRNANSKIVQLWYDVERIIKKLLTPDCEYTKAKSHGLIITRPEEKKLFISLPSGRKLSYINPRVGTNRFGSESIEYDGIDATKHWGTVETFGGKIIENIVQAISRDILCHAMMCLRDYRICAHVHDEVIIECPKSTAVETVCDLMATVPVWAEGLPLRADGFECMFYKKDQVICLQALPAKYNGIQFRSRLEARWAIFFDYCGINWDYEPEGFNLGNEIYYLPDFLLHDLTGRIEGNLFVEVKGTLTSEDYEKIEAFMEFNEKPKYPLLVLGSIFYNGSEKMYHERIIDSCKYPFFTFETLDGTYCEPAILGVHKFGHAGVFCPDGYYVRPDKYRIEDYAFYHARMTPINRNGECVPSELEYNLPY